MSGHKRIPELEAMRGLAALAVVSAHAIYNLPDPELPFLRAMGGTPLRPLIDGRLPVIFFFVLSGFVLTRSLLAGGSPGLLPYAIRRIVRLCLPAAVALTVSAVLYALCFTPGTPPNPTGWLHIAGWGRPPSPIEVLRQALLIGSDGTFYLDNVLWSLVHEIRFSLLLPLLVAFLTRHDRHGGMLLLAAGAVLFGQEIGDHGLGDGRFGDQIARGLAYLVLPVLIFGWAVRRTAMTGALYLFPGGLVGPGWGILSGCMAGGLIFAAIFGEGGRVNLGPSLAGSAAATLYFAPCFLIGTALGMGALDQFAPGKGGQIRCLLAGLILLSYDNIFATTASALLLIVIARQPGRLRDALRNPILVFLGRISFSLYLVHLPLLMALSHGFHPWLPGGAITLLWLILTIPAAWVLHLAAELPAQRLARLAVSPPKAATA